MVRERDDADAGAVAWTEASDEAVVRGVVQRDDQALAALYDRYGGLAYAFAYRLLREHGPAQEVVQDAFLRVWRHAGSFAPHRGSVRRWLLAIVHHGAIDRIRGGARRPQDDAPLAALEQVPGVGDPWPEVARRWRHLRLHRHLARLPASQRQALELAYFDGYTQREIAALLQVPVGTVNTRIRLGLQKLRILLVETDGEESA